jgi:hypothetical protein
MEIPVSSGKEGSLAAQAKVFRNAVQYSTYALSRPESIERSIEDQAFSLSYDLVPPPPPSVSLTGDTQED